MIPWKMSFTGIRDYQPTSMDLSGKESHILITGPNGAGKSTITYCMGVVLYSSKVDIEGLKSRNLLPNDTWKAHIRLLFKNEGRMRIDAPMFIEFAVYILQEPGQPTKKEFVINSGDNPDQWDETIKYTSGDRQYNFTAYKKDLQFKYKIDPDLFYLIWYQQEVNQFAVMDPQERFRIFAEMHGIDQVQRNWEESVEQLKDVQESLRTAEANVANKKQWLGIARSALNRYEDNHKRLVEGGKSYATAMLQLELYYKQEQLDLAGKKTQLNLDQEIVKDRIIELQEQGERLNKELLQIKEEKEQLQINSALLEEQIAVVKVEMDEITSVITELDIQLKDLNKEKSRITRTEQEVHQQLSEITLQLVELNIEIVEVEATIQEIDDMISELRDSTSELNAQIQQDKEQDQLHQERLRQYRSSHDVHEDIKRLEQSIHQSKHEQEKKTKLLAEITDEQLQLENNQMWSVRQRESIVFFRSKGVRAYALNDLVELSETARLAAEEHFESIKYTVFFDASHAEAPNDLYHVPLRNVVPDRSITEIPTLHIRLKKGISDDIFPHAVKALWWVEQFFLAGETRIENRLLIDSKGIRGSQEKKTYLLSPKALLIRKNEIEQTMNELNKSLKNLDLVINSNTQTWQELNAIIQSVRESEAFLTKKHEREGRVLKYNTEMQRLRDQKEQIASERAKQMQLTAKQIKFKYKQDILESEAEFYERLGQQKEQFETLQLKNQHLRSLSDRQDRLKQQSDNSVERVNVLEGNERGKQRDLLNNQDDMQRATRSLNQIDNQIKVVNEELDASKINLLQTIEELENFKGIAEFIYDEVASELKLESNNSKQQQSITKLREQYESGKITFNSARNEPDIDPMAPENYKAIEEEYHRLQDEYKRTSLLFEENQERTEKLKDQLETTINMRVLEIQQRFKNYMSSFQFEGQIDWNQQEDRRGRTLFYLYIKARKEGHRGTLEDVSVKARGGRVGKGVSGGEESLSSLLFALALLQNLQTAPGFIVMDEFDSALDEQRKLKVFDLYTIELQRKLIILSPKSHENSYLNRFSKAYIVHHDPTLPRSKVTGLIIKQK